MNRTELESSVRASTSILNRVATSIDVVPGRGGMFSLEGPEGLRSLTRSRLYTDEEKSELAAGPGAD